MGEPPSLLNASGATNFIYELETKDEDLEKINSLKYIKQRFKYVTNIKFIGAVDKIFSKNLLFIDSLMENIIGIMLLYKFRDGVSKCSEIADKLENDDPLNFQVPGLYTYKIKKLFYAIALGMQPSKLWNGDEEANGGYIIVKKDGDVLAYYLYNRNNFEKYLLNNTKLETGKTTRHNFAKIYEDNGKKYIILNLQVRFK